jgi:transglutaminase-like putative cysteine protease
MPFLTVDHMTVYRYREPVTLGEHRMMFRPRESHDLRLLSSRLLISPQPAYLRWLHDPFDNSVAVATFEGTVTELRFESSLSLAHFDSTQPEYPLEDNAKTYPFSYSDEDLPNLGQALTPRYENSCVSQWVLRFLDDAGNTPTMQLLTNLTRGIQEELSYVRRSEKGTQSPLETLQRGEGSCRDFAVLMIEGVRSLGIAARFVSGYIFAPDDVGLAGGGETHAWMQAYLPGAGWIDFDPTNSIIGNRNLIRVAVAWSPEHALPLWGTFSGPPNSFIAMNVEVRVTEASQLPQE